MSTYLVIGGSSGIGKALVGMLDREGHSVLATFYKNELEDKGNIQYFHLDVNKDFKLDFLPDTLDGLVYCPGAIHLKPFHRISLNSFMEDYRLQVGGAIQTIQQSLNSLKQSAQASVIMFSTIAVQYGFNFHTQVASSKGALEGLTKSLAAELAPSIRVNAVAPSLTDTPLASRLINSAEKKKANAERHPLKRIGEAEDIASMANYLLSPQASWISGQIFHVDGGMSTLR